MIDKMIDLRYKSQDKNKDKNVMTFGPYLQSTVKDLLY